jgi:hypothetical protein
LRSRKRSEALGRAPEAPSHADTRAKRYLQLNAQLDTDPGGDTDFGFDFDLTDPMKLFRKFGGNGGTQGWFKQWTRQWPPPPAGGKSP